MNTVVVPCEMHGKHSLDEKQAGRVIVALYARAEDLALDDGTGLEANDRCAESMLLMALDQEGYAEYVDAAFEGIGIDRHLDEQQDVSRLVKREGGAR